MMRNCAREIDGEYCGRPHATTRLVTTETASRAFADPAYRVDLCAEHAAEYDQDHL